MAVWGSSVWAVGVWATTTWAGCSVVPAVSTPPTQQPAYGGGGGSSSTRPFWENVRGRQEAPIPVLRSTISGRLTWSAPKLKLTITTERAAISATLSRTVAQAPPSTQQYDTIPTLPELVVVPPVSRATSCTMLRIPLLDPQLYGILRSKDREGEKVVLEAAAHYVNSILTAT